MEKKIIVLAGTRREFLEWLLENNVSKRDAIFGCNPEAMMGIEASRVVTVGTFFRQFDDADALLSLAKTRVR